MRVAATGYGLAVNVRNRLYDSGWKRTRAAGVPVISIGNVTAGGTGKTPFVAWMTHFLTIHRRVPVVLSRGYGHTSELGVDDENRVLAEHAPDVPVVVDPDRVRGAHKAVAEHAADVLVLDDGFQHRRLRRDLDIVLVDALQPFGGGRLLPRGLLREPLSSLKRADLMIITRSDLVPARRLREIRSRLRELAPGAPVCECVHRPSGIREVGAQGVSEKLPPLLQGRWLAFCGLGNPEGFHATLRRMGVAVASFRVFPDHHAYRAEDVRELMATASALGCGGLVTTEKDAVKVECVLPGGLSLPVLALRVRIDFPKPAGPLYRAVLDALSRSDSGGRSIK